MKNYTNDNMYIIQSNNVNKIIGILDAIIEYIDVIIIDSLPNLITEDYELNYNTNKVITEVQKLVSMCKKNECDLIIVNQKRWNKNNNVNTYGIRRLYLYYDKRVEITKEGQ